MKWGSHDDLLSAVRCHRWLRVMAPTRPGHPTCQSAAGITRFAWGTDILIERRAGRTGYPFEPTSLMARKALSQAEGDDDALCPLNANH
jgi:hypothetical protein